MKCKALFILLLSPICSLAQNLVPNPSFEEYEECPQWLDNFYAEDWLSPTWGSPDLYNTCSDEQLGIPQNVVGWQQPRTGNGYVGIWLSDFNESEYREYVQCQLISPLEENEQYQVSYYVSRADSSTRACSRLGAYFSSTPISYENNNSLPYIPQIISNPTIPIVDALNWVHVIDTITALGGESYITIGVFTSNSNTNWINVNGGWMSEAYYYIDDVSVVKATPISIEEDGLKHKVSVYVNSTNKNAEVLSNQLINELSIFSISGQLLNKAIVNSTKFTIDMSQYSPGTYLIVTETIYTSSTNKLIIH